MPTRNKIFQLIILSLITAHVYAQSNTNSPYSRFGIGDILRKGTALNYALGQSGIGLRQPNTINYLNPASYTSQDSMSFIFDIGVFTGKTKFETSDNSASAYNSNIDHLAMSFPITKWWFSSLGIMGYSNTGYQIKDTMRTELDTLTTTYYQGDGGINQIYFGNAFKIGQHLSLGFNFSYLFGSINRKWIRQYPNNQYAASTTDTKQIIIDDYYLTYGLQYYNTYKDYKYNIGFTLSNKSKISSHLDRIIHNDYVTSISDTTFTGKNSNILLPLDLGFGFSINKNDRLLLTMDYLSSQWKNSTILGSQDSLVNSNSFRFGIQLTPNPNSFRSYFEKIHYRFGGYYTNSYLQIYGQQIKDYGLTFGLGLPYKNSKSTFNLAFMLGQRGTTSNKLIKENYGVLSLSINLYDFWFYKQKYN